MRLDRTRLAWFAVAALASLTWIGGVRAPLGARQVNGPTTGFREVRPDEPAPRVFFQAPVTAEAARAWIALQKKVPIPFPDETPLRDVLKYIQAQFPEKDGSGRLPICVDPQGLQEADKTMDSPVQLDQEDLPLGTALKILLRQVDLAYYVQKDGLLIITNAAGADHGDGAELVLDQLRHLREEVGALRAEVAALRGQPVGVSARRPAPATRAGMQPTLRVNVGPARTPETK